MKKYEIKFRYFKTELVAGIPYPLRVAKTRRVTLYSKSMQQAKKQARYRVPVWMSGAMQTAVCLT